MNEEMEGEEGNDALVANGSEENVVNDSKKFSEEEKQQIKQRIRDQKRISRSLE
eukprot:CAMPEP_0174274348 /NCGR_PEP_ID=MMETSP0439-20130205/57665_1 /TAXON_ID=0 /ORGANISM="Stereomyxa ramosa, Strain Chinc5" /LENGTH=53 /DNA_ID=CAMNT_0015366039 /DNA_START=64 /DNA_END=222 /DNA_ORIENTATION=+